MGRATIPSIEDLTELVRQQAYRIDELEATLRALMVTVCWCVKETGMAMDDAREALDDSDAD